MLRLIFVIHTKIHLLATVILQLLLPARNSNTSHGAVIL